MRPRDQAVGVMVQKKEFFPMPHIGWNTGRPTATSRTIFGFRMPPVIPALWHSLTTTQPGGFIVCNFRRVKGVFNNFRDLWNDFCLWSSHRQFRELEPRPFAFSERDQKHWRGLKAGQYQIAYQDPSADPKWRMKQIIEVKDYSDLDHAFHVYCANMTWYVGGHYFSLSFSG